MNAPTKEMSTRPASSDPLRLFLLEIWDMVIEQLKYEESSQHLSRLARTCRMLYQRTIPFLYGTVRLAHSESGARLAVAIEQRPELAKLIREIRHKEDSGSELASARHLKFYKMAAGLPDLRTLVLRRNPRPSKFQWLKVRTTQWAEEARNEAWNVRRYRLHGFGPRGKSCFSPPPDTAKIVFDYNRGDQTLFWHALLQNPPGLPALRSCHIGSHFNLDVHNTEMDNACMPQFNEAIFRHPGLRTLCITGATFHRASYPKLTHTDTPLQELTLLNCPIEVPDLTRLLQFPKALKKITLRPPRVGDDEDYVTETDYPSALHKHRHSLEYIDYELYWGGDDMANFSSFTNLKHLTIALASLSSHECLELVPEDELLPTSLESLTIRYDEVRPWVPTYMDECAEGDRLPNLRLVTFEIPELMSQFPSSSADELSPPARQVCQEINTWQDDLKEFDVELRAIVVPSPLEMPKYETCACECLPFFYRRSYHPRPDMRSPSEIDDDWDALSTGSFMAEQDYLTHLMMEEDLYGTNYY